MYTPNVPPVYRAIAIPVAQTRPKQNAVIATVPVPCNQKMKLNVYKHHLLSTYNTLWPNDWFIRSQRGPAGKFY